MTVWSSSTESLWPNLQSYSRLSLALSMQSTYWSADASQRIKKKKNREKTWAALGRRVVQWEVCFCVYVVAAVGGVREFFFFLPTHATKQSHRPCKLSLDSWHSADDSRGLAGINLHRVCLLHHFIDLWPWVHTCAAEKACFCQTWVCIYLCVRVHKVPMLRVQQILIFPCDYKWKSSGIFEIPPWSYQNPGRWWKRAGSGFWTNDAVIKSGWSIRFCCVCRMNMSMKAAWLLQMSISWASVSMERKLKKICQKLYFLEVTQASTHFFFSNV